jgi:hypothetical protein
MEPIANTTTTTAAASEIEQLVRQHRVRWAVYPEWGSDASWRQQKVGFDLELTGTHFEPKHTPSPGCDECQVVYLALHRIAEFILPRELRPTKYDIDVFTGTLAQRHPSDAPRVTVTIRLVHRDHYREPVDDCEVTCLSEMEQSLATLGATRG